LAITSSVALLLASLGEMINQRAGIFNLGCEGIMSMGAFLGMLLPYAIGHGQATSQVYNVLGLLSATVMGALLGMFFGLVVITFRAPQGIAGIGLQMFGTGAAGTLFRHFVGGTQSIPGITTPPIPLLSRIPVIGPIFFSQNILVYVAFLLVPLSGYVLFKTPWGLAVRAVGTHPRAADSIGINVTRIRYQSLAVGGALAGLAGAYLSLCQAKMFSDSIVSGRGFIAVALVYFGTLAAGEDHVGGVAVLPCPDLPDGHPELRHQLPVRFRRHAAVRAGHRRPCVRPGKPTPRANLTGNPIQSGNQDVTLSGNWKKISLQWYS
jgi:simple sugar transport system permease protein